MSKRLIVAVAAVLVIGACSSTPQSTGTDSPATTTTTAPATSTAPATTTSSVASTSTVPATTTTTAVPATTVPPATTTTAPLQPFGEGWDYFEDTDLLTGERSQSVLRVASDYVIADDYGYSEAPAVVIACYEDVLTVGIWSPGAYISAPYGEDLVDVAYRIDDGSVIEDWAWPASSGDGVLLFDEAHFVTQLLDGDQLTYRIFGSDGTAQVTAVFGLAGLDDALDRLSLCWP